MDIEDHHEDAGLASMDTTAVKAQHNIEATLLALARNIRTPRAYVGYSAFVLFAMLFKCQPCVLEGAERIDLLETFAPWAKESCTTKASVMAIPCCLKATAGGSVECVPISDQYPLHKMCHFVAGVCIPGTAVAGDGDAAAGFEAFYAQRGVAALPTVVDGDCALDVMDMMLGRPASKSSRDALRVEISDYLIARIREPWMHAVMVACQELNMEDVRLAEQAAADALPPAPQGPPPAVAEPAEEPPNDVTEQMPDEETLTAMTWASGLDQAANVISLIRALPNAVVDENVRAYKERESTAVAEAKKPAKIDLGPHKLHRLAVKTQVAIRFHNYCRQRGIIATRLPRFAMETFIEDNIAWMGLGRTMLKRNVRRWYDKWRDRASTVLTAAAVTPGKAITQKTNLKSKAKKAHYLRIREEGGGRRVKAPLVRHALYEWWAGLRYAIDWTKLAAERRSRGKKSLARFPREVLCMKVRQLLEEHACACLLNGTPAQTFRPTAHWFKRWEEDYGLNMKKANRKYEVPRRVQKERLELFWVTLFRIRKFIMLKFGYDPLILNWDQSPFHHNETGSQDKATLCVRGDKVPIVQGNVDTKSRWTANLTTASKFTAVADGTMPPAECMFKAARDGIVLQRLRSFHRSRGLPKWLTVT